MIGWKRKWCTVNREFCEDGEVARWRAIGHVQRTVHVHPYKNISLARYRVPRKTVKFVPVVPIAHGRVNVYAHRKSIKPCNLKKNVLGAFYRG